jgi:peptide/nickel transport system permease protein
MTDAAATAPAALAAPQTLWGDVWRQFRTHKGAMVGRRVPVHRALVILGPYIWTVDPNGAQHPRAQPSGP